jgi:hypothetical protein
MTNMESLNAQLAEKERQHRVYEKAMASLRRQHLDEEGAGLALMFGWDEFGGQTKTGFMARAAKFAELFCIGFAFFAPVLMFWIYVL